MHKSKQLLEAVHRELKDTRQAHRMCPARPHLTQRCGRPLAQLLESAAHQLNLVLQPNADQLVLIAGASHALSTAGEWIQVFLGEEPAAWQRVKANT